MVGKDKQKVTLSLDPRTLEILRGLAKGRGMTAERGPGAGEGNVSRYLDSLAWAERNKRASKMGLQYIVIADSDGHLKEVEFRGEKVAEYKDWVLVLLDDGSRWSLEDEQDRALSAGKRYGFPFDVDRKDVIVEQLFRTEDDRYILLVTLLRSGDGMTITIETSCGLTTTLTTPTKTSCRLRPATRFIWETISSPPRHSPYRFLIEVSYDDLCPGGRFRLLGQKAGIAPSSLTLDEALVLTESDRQEWVSVTRSDDAVPESDGPSPEEHLSGGVAGVPAEVQGEDQ